MWYTILWLLSWYVCGVASAVFIMVLFPTFKNESCVVIDSDDITTALLFGLLGPLTLPVMIGFVLCLALSSFLFNSVIYKISHCGWIRKLKITIPLKPKPVTVKCTTVTD